MNQQKTESFPFSKVQRFELAKFSTSTKLWHRKKTKLKPSQDISAAESVEVASRKIIKIVPRDWCDAIVSLSVWCLHVFSLNFTSDASRIAFVSFRNVYGRWMLNTQNFSEIFSFKHRNFWMEVSHIFDSLKIFCLSKQKMLPWKRKLWSPLHDLPPNREKQLLEWMEKLKVWIWVKTWTMVLIMQ